MRLRIGKLYGMDSRVSVPVQGRTGKAISPVVSLLKKRFVEIRPNRSRHLSVSAKPLKRRLLKSGPRYLMFTGCSAYINKSSDIQHLLNHAQLSQSRFVDIVHRHNLYFHIVFLSLEPHVLDHSLSYPVDIRPGK